VDKSARGDARQKADGRPMTAYLPGATTRKIFFFPNIGKKNFCEEKRAGMPEVADR
jgi:hypothetical protein